LRCQSTPLQRRVHDKIVGPVSWPRAGAGTFAGSQSGYGNVVYVSPAV
jgi:hypothetical protein